MEQDIKGDKIEMVRLCYEKPNKIWNKKMRTDITGQR